MAKTTTRIFETVVTFRRCATCDIPVAMTENQERIFRELGGNWCCVLGHSSTCTKNEAQQLRAKLVESQDKIAHLETNLQNTQRLMDAETKKRQRLMKRVENGVCPHCHRTFQQLARHMKDKHGAA